MKLEPGAPLAINLIFDKDQPPMPAAGLMIAQGLAQLKLPIAAWLALE